MMLLGTVMMCMFGTASWSALADDAIYYYSMCKYLLLGMLLSCMHVADLHASID